MSMNLNLTTILITWGPWHTERGDLYHSVFGNNLEMWENTTVGSLQMCNLRCFIGHSAFTVTLTKQLHVKQVYWGEKKMLIWRLCYKAIFSQPLSLGGVLSSQRSEILPILLIFHFESRGKLLHTHISVWSLRP